MIISSPSLFRQCLAHKVIYKNLSLMQNLGKSPYRSGFRMSRGKWKSREQRVPHSSQLSQANADTYRWATAWLARLGDLGRTVSESWEAPT